MQWEEWGTCLHRLTHARAHTHAHIPTPTVCGTGSSGPVVLCLHGGGYSGMSWALVAALLKDR